MEEFPLLPGAEPACPLAQVSKEDAGRDRFRAWITCYLS